MSLTNRLNRFTERRLRSAALLSGLTLFTFALAGPVSAAFAQAAQARTLDGKVVNGGQPVKGAVVHLKDTRTLSQKSYITSDDGSYRFAQLSGTSDYEVWADWNGKKSSIKTVSSFDTKSSFSITLKMD